MYYLLHLSVALNEERCRKKQRASNTNPKVISIQRSNIKQEQHRTIFLRPIAWFGTSVHHGIIFSDEDYIKYIYGNRSGN